MKKNLLILVAMMVSISYSYSQATFNTGNLGIDVDEYGQIELFAHTGIYQLDRASILVGTSPTAVFDYKNDAEQHDPTVLVSNPQSSDFEIYGAYDNTYSGDPPNVIVKLNAYGWTDMGYVIVKFNIMNNETSAIKATAGLDIIPYLNEEYGFDSISYNNSEGVIRFHRGTGVNMGMKLLSASLSSLYSFEWYSGYSVDSDYWTWMHYGSLQPLYASNTADGPVTITAQDSVALNPGESFNVFYAMALGDDEQEMLSNIAAASQKYELLTVSVKENQLAANEFTNYPNPFKTSTKISYKLPGNGLVSLKVYDALGNEKATLVNEKQTGGMHTLDFDAKDLSSGVYSYRLTFNDQVITNKMLLIK
jgi:hypothetical protein